MNVNYNSTKKRYLLSFYPKKNSPILATIKFANQMSSKVKWFVVRIFLTNII